MEVKCPSGLRGEVRKLMGAEADILGDRQAAKKGETFDKILRACWERTIDAGPYSHAQEGERSVDWGRVLICDRTYALVAIRIATYGPDYSVSLQCPAYSCKEKFHFDVDLHKLPVYDLPETSVDVVNEGGNQFTCHVGDHEFGFKLLDGRDEKLASRRITKNRDKIITTAIASRITSIDGENVNYAKAEEFMRKFDGDFHYDLLDAFEEVDGGIEQLIEVECPHCLTGFEVNLPFEGADFWSRGSRLQRKQKRGSRQGNRARTMVTEISEEATEKE